MVGQVLLNPWSGDTAKRTFPFSTFKGGGESLAFVMELRPKGFRLAACFRFWMDAVFPLWRRWER